MSVRPQGRPQAFYREEVAMLVRVTDFETSSFTNYRLCCVGLGGLEKFENRLLESTHSQQFSLKLLKALVQ